MLLKRKFLSSILLLYLLNSCNTTSSSSTNWQFFSGRDEGLSLERPLLYRARVPSSWLRKDPSSTESIADTMKANCEFYIQEGEQSIRLTLHTFPTGQGQMRIPPDAQIDRWQRQFEELDSLNKQILPISYGGFNGRFFEGEGILQGVPTKVMGWSMQLATTYERQLSQHPVNRYKCADYTIKVSGPPELINKHRAALLTFAESFELLDECPFPL